MSLFNDDRREQDAYDRVVEEQRLIVVGLDAAKAAGRSEERQRCTHIVQTLMNRLIRSDTLEGYAYCVLEETLSDIEAGR